MAAEERAADLSRLFEGAPSFTHRLASLPPSRSLDELLDRAERIAQDMTIDDQIELLNGHPRIGAPPAAVSALSHREQGYDRPPPANDVALRELLDRLNDEYERRFGFRFVVFVAGRPRQLIADFMASRLSATREAELRRGLSDVFAIARDRARKLAPSSKEV